jgi:hypothetical protein
MRALQVFCVVFGEEARARGRRGDRPTGVGIIALKTLPFRGPFLVFLERQRAFLLFFRSHSERRSRGE